MDKSEDSNSASWVFVYGTANPSDNSGNTFHLDCSREPIQELTEHDLPDLDSDKNTDSSDGISIISESEIPLEDNNCMTYSDCFKVDDDTQFVENRIVCTNPLCVSPIEEQQHDKWDWKKLCTPLNLVSAGVVISAVLVALCASFKTAEDSPQKESIINANFDKVEYLSNFEAIVDKTISCTSGENPKPASEISAIKRCIIKGLSGEFETEMKRNTDKADKKLRQKKHDKVNYTKQEKRKSHKKKKEKFSGEWYTNMYSYRNELRKMNDNNKKDQAGWYFKRGKERQQTRRNDKYKTYSD